MISLQISAKINLFLDITGTRDDGYHLLSTVMQSIDIYDTITLHDGSSGLFIDCPDVPLEHNTAYRAAIAFYGKMQLPPKAFIKIEKNIPMGAGVGGSSADAAGVLLALNEQYGNPFTMKELSAIAVKIGADVPFLLTGGTMLCEGIGEQLQPVPTGLSGYYLLLQPDCNISAKDAYQVYDEIGGDHSDTQAFISALNTGDCTLLRKFGTNTLARACIRLCPEVNELLTYLHGCADYAFLTGSGSACVGYFEDKTTASNALLHAPAQASYKKIAQDTNTSAIYL